MQDKIMEHLKTYRKTMIELSQLEELFSGQVTYEQFAAAVKSLVETGLLIPVRAGGSNRKPVPLYNIYRINKQELRNALVEEIQRCQLLFHPSIKLHAYLTLPEEEWRRDLPWIKTIDLYLRQKGLPSVEATGPERSLELTGNEKWIDEQGGKSLLERLQLWELLKITGKPDPLMLAINPAINAGQLHRHLIVENKATFYALLNPLKNSSWTSLIFGCGWKIVSNFSLAVPQLGLQGQAHRFYYFGDLDPEGINIWHSLNQKYPEVKPATPFYQALLAKPHSLGKANQQHHPAAIEAFCRHFPFAQQQLVEKLLHRGGYWPQEALNHEELAGIWEDPAWNS
jgi:hypothetical protein